MPTDKRRVLWVVEVKIRDRWTPLLLRTAHTRRNALTEAANQRHYYPDAITRVRAYVPREEETR